eukprot:scaffold4847_cov265-Pinguiococcus_pyrenoidosus.AAC.3
MGALSQTFWRPRRRLAMRMTKLRGNDEVVLGMAKHFLREQGLSVACRTSSTWRTDGEPGMLCQITGIEHGQMPKL